MLNNENLLNTVKSYIENRQFLSAKKIINDILKINKKNIEVLYLDAIINRLTDKIDLAKKQFIKLKSYDLYQVNEQLGLIYFAEQDYLNAEKEYKLALKNGGPCSKLNLLLGVCLAEQKKYNDALAVLNQGLINNKTPYDIFFNIGLIKEKLNLDNHALKFFDKCIEIDPQRKDAYINKAYILTKNREYQEAMDSIKIAIKIDKNNDHFIDNRLLRGQCLHLMRLTGQWENFGSIQKIINDKNFLEWDFRFHPHDIMLWDVKQDLISENLKFYNGKNYLNKYTLSNNLKNYNHKKIRLGYFSSDLREHAVGYSVVELIELHDRTQFEVYAFSFDPGRIGDTMRPRLMDAFDHWHDVQSLSDIEVAKLARTLEIDIAINLNGHTQGARNDIFAYRAAPIQINYLGYPGTMGADYMDYIVADRIVIPEENQKYYSEKVLYLPDCYHANDTKRPIAEEIPTRAECGLPETGFVFACFNASYKITPEVFDSWMRILSAVEGSVLLLNNINDSFKNNIFKNLHINNILKERIIFLKREETFKKHIARQKLADLFLDTSPYNAHTTASDALLVGLPILTKIGKTFPARVSASLLTAIGLEELITKSSEEYEKKAIELAQDPKKLQEIKAKLLQNKETYPLFNTRRFTKNIECLYSTLLKVEKN